MGVGIGIEMDQLDSTGLGWIAFGLGWAGSGKVGLDWVGLDWKT